VAPDPWSGAPVTVPVLTRSGEPGGPPAVTAVIDILSGERDVGTSSQWLTEGVELQIDEFRLSGLAQWRAWVELLRGSPLVPDLRLTFGSLAGSGSDWTATCQWQAAAGGRQLVSPVLSLGFTIADRRITAIRTQRADYTFVIGDAILPPVAFSAMVGKLAASA
jgi:hypothetical protein